MQQRNNRLAMCAGALVAFICALFVNWYTITDRHAADFSLRPNVVVTGFHGNISLLFDLPVWLLLTASVFSTLLLASNIMGWTSIAWWIILAGLILPGIDYVAPLIVADGQVRVSVGPVLAVVATAAAFVTLTGTLGARRPSSMVGAPATNLRR